MIIYYFESVYLLTMSHMYLANFRMIQIHSLVIKVIVIEDNISCIVEEANKYYQINFIFQNLI